MQRCSLFLAAGVCAIGILTLAGWIFDSQVLRGASEHWVSMKPNTAIAFLLSGISLWLQARHCDPGSTRNTGILIGRWLAGLVAVIGALSALEILTGQTLGIDQLIFRDVVAANETARPGQMAPVTAINFICVGIALWALRFRFRRVRMLTQGLAFSAMLVAIFVFAGYLFDWEKLYQFSPRAVMAFHSALAFLALGLGIILAHPDHSLTQLLTDSGPAGMVVRRVLPISFGLPIFMGWLHVAGEKSGVFEYATGSAPMATVYVCILVTLTWWIGVPLRRSDLERRKAEEQLRIFSRAMEQSPASLMITDTAGLIEFVNPRFTELTGYSLEEVRGKNPRFLKSGKTPPEDYANLWQALQSGREWRGELENRKKNGELYWEIAAISPILDEAGRTTHFLAVKKDITERKRLQEEVSAHAQRLDAFFKSATSGLALLDDQYRYIQINETLARMNGTTVEAHVGRTVRELVPALADMIEPTLQHVLATGQPVMNVQFSGPSEPNSQKQRHWVVSYFPVFGPNATMRNVGVTVVDITERKETEEKFLKLSERLLLATRTANVGVWDMDVPSGNILWDHVMCNLYGTSESKFEVSFEVWKAALHPEDRARALDEVQSALRGEKEFNTEFRIVRPDKSVRYIRAMAQVARDASGRMVRMVGTNWDISAHREAEQRVTAALNYNRLLLETSPIGLITYRSDGGVVSANPAIARMIGATLEEVTKQNFRRLESWKQSGLREAAEAALATGKIEVREAHLRSSYGVEVWLSVQFVPFEHEGERQLLGLFTDVTAQKRAEESLRKSEERLQLAMRGANDGLWDWNTETGGVYLSPRWKSMLGYAESELKDTVETWAQLLHPQDREAAHAAAGDFIEGRTKKFEVEFRLQHRDGHYVDVLSRAFLFQREGEPTRMIGTHVDITDRKRAEGELRETHSQLIAASRQAGMAEMATGVLHNVGNVLNSVNISCGLVIQKIRKSEELDLGKLVALLDLHAGNLGEFFSNDPKGQKVLPYLKLIAQSTASHQDALLAELARLQKNIGHMKDVIATQQSVARVGGVTEIVNVTELIEDTLGLNGDTLTKHGIQISRQFESTPPITVDKHKLLQILINLIRNAQQACDESSGAEKQITVRVQSKEEGIRISVADNGIGIAPENMSRIFNHGFTTKKTGHGFGLHSAALSVREMGGLLNVESKGLKLGAAFTLELPLCPPPSRINE